MELNSKIKDIIKIIEESGYECYVVGGAVRNYVLKREIKDYDLVTTASLDEVRKILTEEKFMEYGKGHTLGIIQNRHLIDISSTNNKAIIEDLQRRDFTINTLLYHPEKGLIDNFGAIGDLLDKKIRTVTSSLNTLMADPIRILRALRFEATLGLTCTDDLFTTIMNNINLLDKTPVESITQEFNQILLSNEPSKVLRKYKNILIYLFPAFKDTIGFKQQNQYHIYDVFEHTMKVLDSTTWKLDLRLAALFHDIMKPKCFTIQDNIGHFYGHSKASMEYAKIVLYKYKYSIKLTQKVLKLIYYHDYPLILEDNKLLKFIEKYGINDISELMALKRADILGQNLDFINRIEQIDLIEQAMNRLIEEKKYITIATLEVNGNDLVELGFPKGKIIGEVLKKLVYLVRQGNITNEREILIDYIRTLINIE